MGPADCGLRQHWRRAGEPGLLLSTASDPSAGPACESPHSLIRLTDSCSLVSSSTKPPSSSCSGCSRAAQDTALYSDPKDKRQFTPHTRCWVGSTQHALICSFRGSEPTNLVNFRCSSAFAVPGAACAAVRLTQSATQVQRAH